MSLRRYHEENAAYFVTFTIKDRKKIFNNRSACQLLVDILTYNKFLIRYNIYAFVIMPDHCYLIIQPLGKMGLPEIMRRIKGNFSRFYNVLYHENKVALQKGYYDRGISSQTELTNTILYIHNNPVRAKLVSNIADYYFSSYQYYENGNTDFEPLLKIID